MVDWLRLFKKPFSDDRRGSQATQPDDRIIRRAVGALAVPSGAIVLGEIMWPPDLVVDGVTTPTIDVSIKTCDRRVAALILTMGPDAAVEARRSVGRIDIDSARMLVADKDAVAQHWTDVGPNRVGVMLTTVEPLLKKRFKLRTTRVNAVRTE